MSSIKGFNDIQSQDIKKLAQAIQPLSIFKDDAAIFDKGNRVAGRALGKAVLDKALPMTEYKSPDETELSRSIIYGFLDRLLERLKAKNGPGKDLKDDIAGSKDPTRSRIEDLIKSSFQNLVSIVN